MQQEERVAVQRREAAAKMRQLESDRKAQPEPHAPTPPEREFFMV